MTEPLDLNASPTLETQSAEWRTGGRELGGQPPLAIGDRLGRYEVVARLGAGAMGVVYRARDPRLDRDVAIKLLPSGARGSRAGRARLEREAQALAKLAHPNVVAIHDVGVHDEQVFVAMELVEGQTLRDWMSEGRPWRAVLAVFLAAGDGLAAAHAAGLIHRDIKPDNIMVGADGRARVMDFGLARAEVRAVEALDVAAGLGEVTQAGALVGTPAYMAPEQLRRHDADARADQFGFCVALFEALYGVAPFAGNTVYARLTAIEARRVEAAKDRVDAPAWVRSAILRGLSPAPDDRFPSMAELLAELRDDPAVRRRRWALGAAFVGLLGLAGWGIAGRAQEPVAPPPPEICVDMGAPLEGVWDDGRRTSVEAALLATGSPLAESTAVRVRGGLDDYAARWTAARTEACEATARGEQSEAMLDLRMACLDGRLDHLRAAVDVLAEADRGTVVRAVELVKRIPSLERCADFDALTAEHPPPEDPELAAEVRRLEQALAGASAIATAGKYGVGLERVVEVMPAVVDTGHGPLVVGATRLRGRLEARSGRYFDAVETLESAYHAAVAQRSFEEAAAASSSLVRIYGSVLAQPEQAARWDRHAESMAEASGSSRATLANNRGLVSLAQGDEAAAREAFELALELQEQRGADPLSSTPALHNLATMAIGAGDWETARRNDTLVCEIVERDLGPAHPALLPCSTGLARVAAHEGDWVEAQSKLERAIGVTRDALGVRHPRQMIPMAVLSDVLRARGELAAAQRNDEHALVIALAAFGPAHPKTGVALASLGETLLAQERFAAAVPVLERAAALCSGEGTDPVVAAAVGADLRAARSALGDLDRAHAQP